MKVTADNKLTFEKETDVIATFTLADGSVVTLPAKLIEEESIYLVKESPTVQQPMRFSWSFIATKEQEELLSKLFK